MSLIARKEIFGRPIPKTEKIIHVGDTHHIEIAQDPTASRRRSVNFVDHIAYGIISHTSYDQNEGRRLKPTEKLKTSLQTKYILQDKINEADIISNGRIIKTRVFWQHIPNQSVNK